MKNRLIDWLHKKYDISLNHVPLNESEDFVSCLALLFKLAGQDGDTAPSETARILDLISNDSRVRVGEALKTLQAAQEKSAKIDTDELLKFINQTLTLQQKTELLEMLYLVLRSDDKQTDSEHALVQKFAAAAGISEDDHADVYKRALERKNARN